MQTRSHLGHLLKPALFGHKLNALGTGSSERVSLWSTGRQPATAKSTKSKFLVAERDVSKLARSKPLKPCNRLLLISGTRNLKHQAPAAWLSLCAVVVPATTSLGGWMVSGFTNCRATAVAD